MNVVVDGGSEPLYRHDEQRWVDRRAQFLQREYGLRDRRSRTLAWSDLGYSSSGIAKRVDSTESTVRGYLDEASERFGPYAAWAKTETQLAIDGALEEDRA
jgi:hypothetical protein